VVNDVLGFNEIVRIASKFSLLHRDIASKTLSMHRLVQAVQRDRIKAVGNDRWFDVTLEIICNNFCRSFESDNLNLCEVLIPHIRAMFATPLSIEVSQRNGLRFAQLLARFGHYLVLRSDYRAAITISRIALILLNPIRRAEPYAHNADRRSEWGYPYIEALRNVAMALDFMQKRPDIIAKCHRMAIKLQKSITGKTDPGYSSRRLEFAAWLMRTGRYRAAEKICNRISASTDPGYDKLRSLALYIRAQCRMGCGDVNAAERLFQELLEEKRKTVGKHHRLREGSHRARTDQ
jgi:tetratricopeptide (TPR) repeat protein